MIERSDFCDTSFRSGWIPGRALSIGFVGAGTGDLVGQKRTFRCTRIEFLRLLCWYDRGGRNPMTETEIANALKTPCPARIKDAPKRSMKDLLS